MREGYKTSVSEKKKSDVAEFVDLINKSPIVGVVNLANLPTQQLNNMRKTLRASNVSIRMGKKRLFKLAIDQIKDKENFKDLEAYLKGMPALLFTSENPFSLFKLLKKSKSKAPAKAGQLAPNDIVVSAGGTQFAPGPIISELGSFGIKTKVNAGKLEITEDVTVAKEGDEINDKLASLLMRLGIEPMEIGLDLVAIYENGLVYTKSVLDIDEDAFKTDLDNAARWAFNLSVEAQYPTADNIQTLIIKSTQESKNLALNADILNKETAPEILAKAYRQCAGVKETLGI